MGVEASVPLLTKARQVISPATVRTEYDSLIHTPKRLLTTAIPDAFISASPARESEGYQAISSPYFPNAA